MSDVLKSIDWILENEGSYSNLKNDTETKWGLTKPFLIDVYQEFPDLLAPLNISSPYQIKVVFISKELAIEIYKKALVEKYHVEKIDSYIFRTKLLDMMVNLGAREAFKLLQRSINSCYKEQKLIEDGILGQKTITELMTLINLPSNNLKQKITDTLKDFYFNVVQAKPAKGTFLKGWLLRAERWPDA